MDPNLITVCFDPTCSPPENVAILYEVNGGQVVRQDYRIAPRR